VNTTALRAGLALAALTSCVLCGDPQTVVVAMFIPNAGRQVFFYALCSLCAERDDKVERVESDIAKRIAA